MYYSSIYKNFKDQRTKMAKNKRNLNLILYRCSMDLFILWSNDLFVHLKMKNEHVHIIAGKDIFAKAQWKQAGFSLIFCRQVYFQICKIFWNIKHIIVLLHWRWASKYMLTPYYNTIVFRSRSLCVSRANNRCSVTRDTFHYTDVINFYQYMYTINAPKGR